MLTAVSIRAEPCLGHQRREAWIWGADGFPDRYGGADTIVYGHKNNAEVDGGGWPRPRIVGKTIGIDTIVTVSSRPCGYPMADCFRVHIMNRADATSSVGLQPTAPGGEEAGPRLKPEVCWVDHGRSVGV